jgi:pyruvate kinase
VNYSRQRRAKIVATIGPASSGPDSLTALLEAGVDVARLNFSHGTHDDHQRVFEDIRRISTELERPVAILQDLQGPKIRIGKLDGGAVHLLAGRAVTLTTTATPGDADRIHTPYSELPEVVKAGDDVLLSDGLLRLSVLRVNGDDVECEILEGGVLRERAGMNLPGTGGKAPALTEKDVADLAFGMQLGVDYVALSFVRRAADVLDLKSRIARAGSQAAVIAKLEKPQAIDDLDAILQAADAVMVARGDLGVELSPEKVPFLQKQIIRRAAAAKIPVITATQMLESMIDHPRPTRAEASDVANAILDGTDAVMLSGETAIGQNPAATVRMMDRIVVEAETHSADLPHLSRRRRDTDAPSSFEDAVAVAAVGAASDIQARAIIAFTQSGFTGRLISKLQPRTALLAFTHSAIIYRQLALFWGVQPRLSDFVESTTEMISAVDDQLRAQGLVDTGDPLVFLAGTPATRSGSTNLVRLHVAGSLN